MQAFPVLLRVVQVLIATWRNPVTPCGVGSATRLNPSLCSQVPRTPPARRPTHTSAHTASPFASHLGPPPAGHRRDRVNKLPLVAALRGSPRVSGEARRAQGRVGLGLAAPSETAGSSRGARQGTPASALPNCRAAAGTNRGYGPRGTGGGGRQAKAPRGRRRRRCCQIRTSAAGAPRLRLPARPLLGPKGPRSAHARRPAAAAPNFKQSFCCSSWSRPGSRRAAVRPNASPGRGGAGTKMQTPASELVLGARPPKWSVPAIPPAPLPALLTAAPPPRTR